MSWYLNALKNYFGFSGRARRKEYWYFALFNIIFSVLLIFIDVAIGTYNVELGMGALYGIYTLAVLIPNIAVTFRRLHDTDRSGWWLLILLIPLIGAIVFLVFMLLDSHEGSNRYGANPKAA